MARSTGEPPTRFEWERAVRDSNLPAPSKLIALILGTHTGSKCRRPYVSIRTLAQETSLGRRTVVRHLNLLTEGDGRFVQKQERMDQNGRQTSNEYRLTFPTADGGVQEMHPGVSEVHPRGGHSDTEEGVRDAPKGSKKEGNKTRDAATIFADAAWEVYLEELGGNGRPPTLTKKRRHKLEALYQEQLSDREDPVAAFREILKILQASDYHMSKRSYHMPESFLRNEERRERWTLEALDVGASHRRSADGPQYELPEKYR